MAAGAWGLGLKEARGKDEPEKGPAAGFSLWGTAQWPACPHWAHLLKFPPPPDSDTPGDQVLTHQRLGSFQTKTTILF